MKQKVIQRLNEFIASYLMSQYIKEKRTFEFDICKALTNNTSKNQDGNRKLLQKDEMNSSKII